MLTFLINLNQNLIILSRETLTLNKGKGGKAESAKSEGSKKEPRSSPTLKPMNLNLPIANITEDLVNEILSRR